MATFDGPGRGRRQCPSCKKYTGVKALKCDCGHIFGERASSPSVPRPVVPREIAIFDEGGRGRKQCPKCKKYVGSILKVCVCGHEFEAREKEVLTYTEGGRGKKQCPSCKKYVGAKSGRCVCGHDFLKPSSSSLKSSSSSSSSSWEKTLEGVDDDYEEVKPRKESIQGRLVYIPAGKCPVRLKDDPTQEDVHFWAEMVVAKGHEEGVHYSIEALVYFLREFVDIHSPHYQEVKGMLLAA